MTENIENIENNNYKVISTYTGGLFKENILNGATISIKGAKLEVKE